MIAAKVSESSATFKARWAPRQAKDRIGRRLKPQNSKPETSAFAIGGVYIVYSIGSVPRSPTTATTSLRARKLNGVHSQATTPRARENSPKVDTRVTTRMKARGKPGNAVAKAKSR